MNSVKPTIAIKFLGILGDLRNPPNSISMGVTRARSKVTTDKQRETISHTEQRATLADHIVSDIMTSHASV